MANTKKSSPMEELGQHGLPQSSGYISEELLPELLGDRGRKIYREMSDNDPICGAFIYAIESYLRKAEWIVQPAEPDTEGEYSKFFEENMNDMEHSWGEFVSDVLTELIFGFSFFEKIYKRRVGPFESSPKYRSKYSDGRIGIRKLSSRAQETLYKWDMDENENAIGFIQQPYNGGAHINIPFSKGLLFRTSTRKNNPEGRSALRAAYTSWFYKKSIQTIEAIGVERDIAGLPVVSVPSAVLKAGGPALNAYVQISRDLKYNKQGGVVIPSDTYVDSTGKMTNNRKVTIELLSSDGSKKTDTNEIINRYDRNIVISVLAGFLLLNGDKGSFALSKNQSDLFLSSLQCLVDDIAEVINKDLIPELWKLNGFDPEYMPTLKAGKVAPVSIEDVGRFIQQTAAGGLMLTGDIETENHLRDLIDFPELAEEDGALRPMDPESKFHTAEEMARIGQKYNNNDKEKKPPNAGRDKQK